MCYNAKKAQRGRKAVKHDEKMVELVSGKNG